jgi:cytochrome P450/NADPH-cytochrome P450 reductase
MQYVNTIFKLVYILFDHRKTSPHSCALVCWLTHAACFQAFRFGLGYTFGSVKAENVVGSFNARFNPFCDPQQVMREKLGEAVGVCHEFVDELIEKTRSGEIGGPLSVLSMMLNERSPSTGDMVKLNDVFGHLMTIMIAGHETTAAALGHLFYYLGKNPRCVEKAVAEIEAVLGDRVNPTFADIGKLHYVEACFKEALRLQPSVPAVTRDVGNDTVILDKYLLRKGQRVIFNNVAIHRDPEQWDQGGAFGHPSLFNPERHMPGGPPRHPNAFAAFGFGVRACIGQQLAVLEAKTFLAMVLNFFSFSLPDGFQLVSSSKDGGASPSPENLRLHLTARPSGPLDRALKALLKGDLLTTTTTTTTPATQKPAASVPVVTAKHDTPLLILFGSNSGTCEDFAQQVATAAAARGFCPEVLSLDAGAKLELGEKFGAGVIITSTYNGTPPDNAATFASEWLPKQGAGSLAGKKFVVCGVGNTNWEATYQKFPTRVYETLRATSAEELMGFTAVDAANPSFVEDFQDWLDALMRTLSVSFGLSQVAPGGATPAGGIPPTKKEPAVRAVPPDAYASFFSTIAELYQYINATYPDTDLSAHVKADSFAVRCRLPYRY